MDVFLQDNFNGYGDLSADLSDDAVYSVLGGSGIIFINDIAGTAGVLTLEDPLPADYRIHLDFIPQKTVGYLGAVVAGAPGITDRAAFNASRRVWAWGNGWDNLHLCVLGTDGEVYTWDGAAWTSGTVAQTYGDFTQAGAYRLTIERGPDHLSRMVVYDDDDTAIVTTDWVAVYGSSLGEETYLISGYPYTDEPFSAGYGFDGKQVEPCYHELIGDADTITINDKMTFDCGGAEKVVRADFINGLYIGGDFDVRLDINMATVSVAAGTVRQVTLALTDAYAASTTRIYLGKRRTNTINYFYMGIFVNGSSVYANSYNSTTTATTLRIVRSGIAVTFYFGSGASWTQIGTYASFVGSDCYPYIYFVSDAAANVFEADNLQVYSGTVLLPNRSIRYFRASGQTVEFAAPEMELRHKIGFEEKDFPVTWGGDSLEIVHAIRGDLGWDLDLNHRIGRDFVEADLALIHAIGETEAGSERDFIVYLDGEELRPGLQYTRIDISEDIDRTPNQITIDVADSDLGRVKEIYPRSKAEFLTPRVEVWIDGALYDSYYWEDLRKSETPEATTWQIWGRNQAARLNMPFAEKLTEAYATTTRKNVMREIVEACDLTLTNEDYLVDDFTIPGNLLVVENEYPLDVLKQLAEADGAIVRSGRGNRIVVRYREYVIE